jgi:hypothetical protein
MKTLQEITGRSRPTLGAYLDKGKKDGEVQRNPRTMEWSLTSKGIQELHRLQDELQRREAPLKHYTGVLYPPKHLSSLSRTFPPPQQIDPARLGFYTHLALSHLPLIMPFQASLYVSEKLETIFESDFDVALDDFDIKPEKARKRILSETLQRLGEQLFWALVTRRLSFLLEWHDYYRKGKLAIYRQEKPAMPHRSKPGSRAMGSAERQGYHASSNPSPLTIENILGFDTSATLDFRGEAAFHRPSKKARLPKKSRQLIGKRLVGSLLLRVAYGDSTLKNFGVVVAEQFAESGLLEEEDALLLKQLIEQADSRKKKTAFNKRESQTIYGMAFRYFEEADRLADLIAGGKEIETGGKLPSIDESPLWIRETLPSKESLGC